MVGQRFIERKPTYGRDWCRRVVVTGWKEGFYNTTYYVFLDGSQRRSSTGTREFLKRFQAEGQPNTAND